MKKNDALTCEQYVLCELAEQKEITAFTYEKAEKLEQKVKELEKLLDIFKRHIETESDSISFSLYAWSSNDRKDFEHLAEWVNTWIGKKGEETE